jgi:16S rRNA (guanine966-N2)-methyltransferase
MPHHRKPRPARVPGGQTSQLRIIGGAWRGRKLAFIPAEGLRPTADRVRETLFNWLAPELRGARCLDLFCGSGALGLEALSRGAAHCDFIDTNSTNLRQVAGHLQVLGAADRGHCHPGPAERYLAGAAQAWDIAFIDPPFHQGLAGPACAQLQERALLAPGARIYLESAVAEAEPALPASWLLHRDKTAGGVRYRLYHAPVA